MADTIKRCSEHLKNFTLMDNTCLKTATLSMQAMGLFAYLMTLPNDWVVYKSELVNHFSNGRDAVYKAFNELIDNGFITFTETKNEKGQFKSYEYFIHEKPVEESKRSVRKEHKKKNDTNNESVNGNPETGKPFTGKPYTENPSLLSTNNTKDLLPSTNNNYCSNKVDTKTSKKISKTQQNEDYLNSVSEDVRINSEKLTNQMLCSFRVFDPNYSRSKSVLVSWQVDFAMFLNESKRSLSEVSKTLNYALSDSFWTKRIFKPANFIKAYQTIFRQSNNSDKQQSSKTSKMHSRFDGSHVENFLTDYLGVSK